MNIVLPLIYRRRNEKTKKMSFFWVLKIEAKIRQMKFLVDSHVQKFHIFFLTVFIHHEDYT